MSHVTTVRAQCNTIRLEVALQKVFVANGRGVNSLRNVGYQADARQTKLAFSHPCGIVSFITLFSIV